MKRFVPALAFLLLAAPAQAQVRLHIELGLPVAPPLVVIQPGVQVVEGFGDEVFFSAGWYWCHRPEGWYRARSPRTRFDFVEARRVPAPSSVFLKEDTGTGTTKFAKAGAKDDGKNDARTGAKVGAKNGVKNATSAKADTAGSIV